MAKVSSKNIAKAIYASVKEKSGAELDTALRNSVEFLAKRNLLRSSEEILGELEKIQDTEENILHAKAESATPLSDQMAESLERALKERYKASDVVLELTENPQLLGGIRIEARDEVIDLTLRNKVSQLQAQLLEH